MVQTHEILSFLTLKKKRVLNHFDKALTLFFEDVSVAKTID